jgi:hypothetical protein
MSFGSLLHDAVVFVFLISLALSEMEKLEWRKYLQQVIKNIYFRPNTKTCSSYENRKL